MRTILLAIAIVASGAAKNIQHIHITNVNANKIKKSEAGIKVIHKNSVNAPKPKPLKAVVKLNRLPKDTLPTRGKKNQSELHLPTTLHESNQNDIHSKRHYTTPSTGLLPKIPTIEHSSLPHMEQVLLVDVTPMLTLTKHTNETANSRSTPSNASTLSKIRQIITSKKNNEPKVPVTRPTPQIDGCFTKFKVADVNNLDLFWPVETRTISSTWGPRVRTKVVRVRVSKRSKRHKQVLKKFVGNHQGIDFNAPRGGDVFAAMDGQVVISSNHRHYGNFVTIDHGSGVTTLYGHCDRNFVVAGEVVRRGQKIAEVGCTGNATGPHVHFELRLDGSPKNPLPFMNDLEEIPTAMLAKK